MSVLQFMGDHPALTFLLAYVLATIAGETIIKVVALLTGYGK